MEDTSKEEGIPQPPFDLDELKDLIKVLVDNNISEFSIEQKGMKLEIKRNNGRSVEFVPIAAPPVVSATQMEAVQNGAQTPGDSAQKTDTETQVQPGTAEESENGRLDQGERHTITSPIVGTFYRKPSPDAESFVEVGDQVSEETVLCIVEAMKLMNPIKADVSGKIVEIVAQDGHPVEYGQPLFLIEPM